MTHRIPIKLLTCALLVAPALSAFGCGDDDPDRPAVDSGAGDGSAPDGGAPSGDGSVDGATPAPQGDGSTPNVGTPDGGAPNVGMPDGGTPNVGTPDASTPDGSRPDGGTIDGSTPIGSTPDGGPRDGGTPGGNVLDGSAPDASSPDAAVPAVGDTWGFTSGNRLVYFERATGRLVSAVAVAVPANETVWGVDVRPADGSIVAVTSAGRLYTIDPQSGATTLKSTLAADPADTSDAFAGLTGTAYGVDFNPVPDRLRVVSNSGQNLRINVDTGAVTTDVALNPTNTGVVAAAYTNSFAAACRTSLYVLDGAQRKLLLQNPPNDGRLTELGSLGDAAIGAVHGFDIGVNSSGNNVALVSATAADGERVAELNLSTGALSGARVVALNAGETLDSLFVLPPSTAPAQASGELLATTVSNRLISFNRGAPGKLCTAAAITGLGAGEIVVGADVRPADGQLYALTNNGKLYTVAVATAAATLKSTLSPAGAVAGNEFAVGFNPVPDRLRVISEAGVNLRINVDDGTVTTDSAITQAAGTPAITAAAYTNAFPGARSTTLWAIDSSSDSLVRVGADPADAAACPNATNPNCGVSTLVRPLGITGDVTAINGFDIEASTGSALAALAIGDAASSTLYAIQPTGPTASVAMGAIGGGERVRSLTFAATPALTAWVVTSDNKLISFAPSAPQTSLTNATLSGLQAAETLVGIDVRPLDGRLYGLGSTGRLYSLAASGAATEVVALTAAEGESFTTLPASTYGFDFNPAADALRLVNRNESNFRVLPSTRVFGPLGSTFVDTALNPTGADIVAAAYTNNFVGSSTTTLYVIGGSVSTLHRQGGLNNDPSPNGGALTAIGALGVNSAFDVGFDIAGGNNGLALAVLEQASVPTLFSINLSTGAASPLNGSATPSASVIGGATGAVRGLALELK